MVGIILSGDSCSCFILVFRVRCHKILLKQSQPSIILNRTMDLPYPSQKDEQLIAQLFPSNRKPSLVLKDSLRNIPALPPLPPSTKKQIQTLIQNDYAYQLKQLVEKQVISMRMEVGKDRSEQNLLHVSCRYNAVKCVAYLLKTYYLYFPAEYDWWVNLGSRERMTPAMLCSLCGSNDALKVLLDYGGVDIHLIDSNKLSAYQIALNAKNEAAIKMLMDYQASKKPHTIDKQKLAEPLDLIPGKLSFCESIYRCLLDCLSVGTYQDNQKIRAKKRNPSVLDVVSGGIQGYFIDKVELGYSKDQICPEDVEWKGLGEFQGRGSSGVLFQTFSPFDMEDISHPIQNILIVFQSLSQLPWLVRRIIQPHRTKPSQYTVTLYPKSQPKTISIDSYLPLNTNGGHPLFISDKKQGWPMLLQKALAKHHGNYKSLQQLMPSDLIESLTGWPVIRRQIKNCPEIMDLMQRITSLGYMFILEGKDQSLLSCSAKHSCVFTVLTFYTKGDKRLVLVNCPFIDPAWVEKERHEILALKILRGHYNCRQQMTIWIEQERLKEYFSSLIIAPIKTSYHRFTLQVTTIKQLYFRLEIGQNQEQPAIIYLLDLETNRLVPMEPCEGWYSEKERLKFLQPEACRQQMISFEAMAGEYLFRKQIKKGRYLLVAWALEDVKLEAVEESFGELQWIACLKKNICLNWDEKDKFKICNTGQYTLLIADCNQKCYATGIGNVDLVQGKKSDNGGIEMVPFEGYHYCVVKGRVENATFYEQQA